MKDWLEEAIEHFPEFKKYYVNLEDGTCIENAHELWIDLEGWFYVAVEKENTQLQKRILNFFHICMSGKFSTYSPELEGAAIICMLQSVGRRFRIGLLPLNSKTTKTKCAITSIKKNQRN